MANKTCVAKTILTFTDDDAVTRTSTSTVSAPYQAMTEGLIDIPDLTADGTEFAIPFGFIDKATALWMKNNSGQDMVVKLNASAALFDLPSGGALLISASALPAGTELSGASFTTSDDQAGVGTVSFKVFGDPT